MGHDLKEGYGRYNYENGEYYKGNWEKDLRHGKGKLCNKNGVIIYKGYWVNGLKGG